MSVDASEQVATSTGPGNINNNVADIASKCVHKQ